MQHKIFTTIVISVFALLSLKAQVAVDESNFSLHIIAALNADWSSVAGDGTLTSDDIATINNLTITGKGSGDELSLKGIEILTAVETLSLNTLKYGGDFSVLPEVTSNLECHGCVIDKFEIFGDLVSLIISDKTTFNDILLSGSQGHKIENIELRNLDIEDFDPTLKSDYRLKGYLKIIDCPKIKHANLRIANSLNMNGVPELSDMDWGTKYTKLGESKTNIIEFSKVLGIVTVDDIYVNNRYGFKSNVTLTLPDKSTPISLDDYKLSASRVSSISGPMTKDEGSNTLIIDWETAGADVASITYRYNCLTGVSKKYLEVELTVKVGEEPTDDEAPVIKVGGVVLGATANYEESVTLTITDNKGVASVTINGTPASEPYIIPAADGTYVVVAKDEKGNQAKTTITIKLPVVEPEDEEAPVIKVGDDVLGETANYEESVTLTITDNKGVASVTINGAPASEPYVIPAVDGTYEVVAKDEKGNMAKTTITIKLPVVEPEDEEAPVIKVGDDVLGETANYEESVTLTITDNKGVASVTINGTPASEPYIIPAVDGVYEVVAKDEKGNQAKTTITITIPVVEPEDEEAPVIKVGDDVLGATASYEESVTLTITDNKGVASVTINGTPASEPYIIPAVDGTYEVVAKDEKGNQAKTTITIKLPVVEPEDEETPVIKVGDDVLGATANYEESVTLTITDNKGVASVTINGTPASEPYIIPAVDGTYDVVAKDEKGNQAKTTITIKLPVVEPEDEEAPVIKVGDDVLGATANYEESVTLTITDNKGVASVTINGTPASEPYVIPAVDGTYEVVAKDEKGNQAKTTITIKLPVVEPEDEEAPVIKVGDKVLGTTANYEESVTLTITDNKGVASVTINGTPASEPYIIPAVDGVYEVVAKDEKGNQAKTTITIKLPVVIEPEPGDVTVIESSEVQTTVFRTIKTDEFRGLEVLAKEKMSIEVYNESGKRVKVTAVKMEDGATRIAMPVGKYKVNIGMFKNIDVVIK